MTREEAKKLLPIVEALSEGKTIQTNVCDEWVDIEFDVTIDIPDSYRIKPEPKYRPFESAEECWNEMLKHEPFGWIQDKDNKAYINTEMIGGDSADCGVDGVEYSKIFNEYTFADGTPFGIKKEIL